MGSSGKATGRVNAAVQIRRDAWGIAHLSARDERDLFFGLGYAMAQDRLWQLDYQRRFVRGELAAILGRRLLANDRTMRLVGFGKIADRDAETVSDQVRTVLDAFSAGINQWIEQIGRDLPVEFEILGYEPAPWRPADSIAIWKHRWWTLTGRLELSVVAEAAQRLLPPELAQAFATVELSDETIVPESLANLPSSETGGAALDEGSNNWVVGGGRTTTGSPILCSDPHNDLRVPSQWFEAQLTCDAFDAAGAVYLGTPGLYLGRNQHVAWGLTNHFVSVRDLYQEETSAEHPGQYRDGAAWRELATDEQTIAIAGEPDEKMEIRSTVRGPIVNELLPRIDDEPFPPISMRWIGAEVPSGFDASLGLLRAHSADDVRAALSQWPCPPLNFVFADRAGNFGYHAAGFVPWRERAGFGLRRANDPVDAWNGNLPFDEMPNVGNPEQGWVATANNVPSRRSPWYVQTAAWSEGYRHRRIRERLEAATVLSPDSIAAIHGDSQDGRARDLVQALLGIVESGDSPTAKDALAALATWDFEASTASVGASVWYAFWVEWCLAVARARFPDSLVPHATTKCAAIARRLLEGDALEWFPRGTTQEEARRAFGRAVAALEKWGGPDVSAWTWGTLHQIYQSHPLATNAELAKLFDTGPFPTSGGSTVRAAGFGLAPPFTVLSCSSYRFVADLSRPDGLRSTQTLGQSSHLGSPHYRDQTRLWLSNSYHPFWMNEKDVLEHLESELTIQPVQ